MGKLSIEAEAPDFVLNDFKGIEIRLSKYRDKKNVLLVFNRGFM